MLKALGKQFSGYNLKCSREHLKAASNFLGLVGRARLPKTECSRTSAQKVGHGYRKLQNKRRLSVTIMSFF